MKVKRIIANFCAHDLAKTKRFYQDVLGLEVIMDHGWIITYCLHTKMEIQLSIASQGGSDTVVPDLSIEVDNVDEALQRMQNAGFTITYGPVDEPWGVRRFYVLDPLGKQINILQHIP